jgi:SpoVK/Ycf46/Vps4 family AAA+-type ATPase
MQTLTGALRGFTMQEAEDCCTMVLVSRAGVYRGKGITDMHALLARIEQEKIAQFNAVPGVTYISADSMTTRVLPGYESLFEMIDQGMSISAEVAMKHRVGRMRSMALAGGPGVGKTDVAISIAAAMSKPLIQWSIGESQDRLVGNSEKNARRVLDIAEATGAVVLVDDIDKAGVGNASHGQSGNDSFGRVVQMLLTHSSQKDSDAVFIYTFNRTRNIPQELIRPGRVDFRGYVRRPDEVTRFEILKTHVAFHGVEADNSDLEKIASDEVTDDWTGAELATLVQAATRHALRHDTIRLDGPWMLSQANDFVPMAKMNVWQDDLAQMETDCQQFTKLGRVDRNTHETTVAGATRNYRSAAI